MTATVAPRVNVNGRVPPATYEMLTADLACVPDRLCDATRWVLWRYVWKPDKDKWTKVPIHPDEGYKVDGTPPNTGLTMTAALGKAERLRKRGITVSGLGVALGDGLTGVDLDACIAAQRRPEPWALKIVNQLDTYTEDSPSRKGLHLLCFGALPPEGRRVGQIEMYDSGRFFTVTGWHFQGTPETVEERSAQLAQLHAETFPPKAPRAPRPAPTATLSVDDAELVRRAEASKDAAKFRRLMAGDTSDYSGNASRADLGLCNFLRIYGGSGDRVQVDRLFRRSGLYRDKWDERHYADGRTYGEGTLDEAMDGELYDAGGGVDLGDLPAPSLNGTGHAPPDDEEDSEEPPAPAPDAAPDRFKLTDVANAERLLVAHGAQLRYCPRWGKWLVWDERRWALDYDACRVRRFARQTARRLSLTTARRFPQEDVSDQAKAFRKHASYSESGRGIAAMVGLAETFPTLWVAPDQLDADPWRINCANGTIDLLTGQLHPHRPEDLMTLIAPVDYDPQAKAPRWEQFITEVTATSAGTVDAEMATYLQGALGHSLTGDVSEQAVYFAYGAGDNGKSTLLNTVRGVLGEYAMQATEDLLMVKRGEQHPTERADLYRKRMVISTEVEDGRRLAESLVKQLTGGENIRARRMREDHWEFSPTHKVWLGANHMPEIRGTDWAIWRRIRVMPFESRFYEPGQAPAGQEHRVKDKQLPEKLKAEAPGILAWMVRGCLAWKRQGLTVPQRVQAATKGYREAMDVLGEFIAERCELEAGATALATPLYRAYVGWCEVGGEKPETQRRFGLRLKERGFTNDKPSTEKDSKGYAQWTGLKLKPISQDTGDIGLKASAGRQWGETG